MYFEVYIFQLCLGVLKDVSWGAVATAGQETVSQGDVQWEGVPPEAVRKRAHRLPAPRLHPALLAHWPSLTSLLFLTSLPSASTRSPN